MRGVNIRRKRKHYGGNIFWNECQLTWYKFIEPLKLKSLVIKRLTKINKLVTITFTPTGTKRKYYQLISLPTVTNPLFFYSDWTSFTSKDCEITFLQSSGFFLFILGSSKSVYQLKFTNQGWFIVVLIAKKSVCELMDTAPSIDENYD